MYIYMYNVVMFNSNFQKRDSYYERVDSTLY
jgi:hypothetical protein